MIDLIKKFWLPVAGFFTSITVSATEQTQTQICNIMKTENLINTNPLTYYFLIGLAGAAGGLVIKIIWGMLKRKFPKLKNIDK